MYIIYEPAMTAHELAAKLLSMPDIPVMATWEGQAIAVSEARISIGIPTTPGMESVILDVDQP